MLRSLIRHAFKNLPICSLVILASCSLPRGGPTTSSIVSSFQKRIIKIDEPQAISLNKQAVEKHKHDIQQTLRNLSNRLPSHYPLINRGDELTINLMSYSSDSHIDINQDSLLAGFMKRELGNFTVDEHCNIHLPYLGNVAVCNMTEEQARNRIQARYEQVNIVREPYVILHLVQNKQNDILITGDVGVPRILPWQAGGIKLSTALTLAQNHNANLIRNNADKSDENKTNVTIHRHGHTYTLPYDIALKNNINLAPGDKIIIKSSPEVRATLVGGGILKAGTYGFPTQPSLLEVLAEAGGFNANNADISKIFVFRKINDKLDIYQFEFKNGHGLAAATFFPISDRDIVFAPESKIVPWLRVVNIAFQMALPAAVLK